jgi:hypothetical protein
MCEVRTRAIQSQKDNYLLTRACQNHDLKVVESVIDSIKKKCYHAPITEQVGFFLMSQNMLGAIWSPRHLIWLLSIVREELDTCVPGNREKCLVLLCKETLQHYKSLTFDEIAKTKSELEASLDKKLLSFFGYFSPLPLLTLIPNEASTTEQFFHSKWEYMKSTLGCEIQV